MSTTLPVTGNTSQTKPENRAFYPALDGLRALAFVMVFLQHYLFMPWGWSGVNLFFVLSGFLITGILYDTRDDRYRVRNFYLRRTLRIFPLYYGVMFVLLLLLPVVHWEISWKWLAWPAYLGNWLHLWPAQPGSPRQHLMDFQLFGHFRTHQVILYLGHFWTLCLEEQFYLVWPFVVFALKDRRKLMWICGLSVPVCLLARVILFGDLPASVDRVNLLSHITPFRLDSLLLGGLIALIFRGRYREDMLRYARFLLLPAFAIALFWAFGLAPRRFHWWRYPYPLHFVTSGMTVLDLLAALLILNALQPRTWLAKFFSQRPLRWLGRLSYGAYVFHDIPHIFYGKLGVRLFGLNPYGPAFVAFVCTFVLASASFRFFEAPFLNLKDRLTLHG